MVYSSLLFHQSKSSIRLKAKWKFFQGSKLSFVLCANWFCAALWTPLPSSCALRNSWGFPLCTSRTCTWLEEMVALLQSISVLVTLKAFYSLLCSTLWFWRFPPEHYSCASARTADFLNVTPADLSLFFFFFFFFLIFYSDLNKH